MKHYLAGLFVLLASCGAPPPSDTMRLHRATAELSEDESSFLVHEVSTGAQHSCALTLDGRVACWGANTGGALGDGTQVHRTRPVWVEGVRFALDVDAGATQTCAQIEGGEVSCWGGAAPGEAGERVPLRGVRAALRQVAVGQRVCALDYRGEAYCWPEDNEGSPEPLHLNAPGQIIDAGIDRVCVLTGPRHAYCFEYGAFDTPQHSELRAATQLAVSGDHACITGQGDVRCWGANAHGQLGSDDASEGAEHGVRVDLPERPTHVTTGWAHSCVTTGIGNVFCWGDGSRGQLGHGSRESSAVPVRVEGFTSPVIRVAAGQGHTCAVQSDRRVFCWGQNDHGQLGNGTREDSLRPVPVDARSLVDSSR